MSCCCMIISAEGLYKNGLVEFAWAGVRKKERRKGVRERYDGGGSEGREE